MGNKKTCAWKPNMSCSLLIPKLFNLDKDWPLIPYFEHLGSLHSPNSQNKNSCWEFQEWIPSTPTWFFICLGGFISFWPLPRLKLFFLVHFFSFILKLIINLRLGSWQPKYQTLYFLSFPCITFEVVKSFVRLSKLQVSQFKWDDQQLWHLQRCKFHVDMLIENLEGGERKHCSQTM